MVTSKTVWFAKGSDKYFDSEKKATEYEKQQALIVVIMSTGLNEDAAKKVAKAIINAYAITPSATLVVEEDKEL